MNSAKRAVQLLQLSSRQLSTSQLTRKTASSITSENVHPGYKKLKAKQEKFQMLTHHLEQENPRTTMYDKQLSLQNIIQLQSCGKQLTEAILSQTYRT